MIITLPKWYGEVEDELRRQIVILAHKQNIRWTFVNDSKLIDESINDIMRVLLRLKQEAYGEFNEEQIKTFKKIEKTIKEDEAKSSSETKSKVKSSKKKTEDKVKRSSGKSSNRKRS